MKLFNVALENGTAIMIFAESRAAVYLKYGWRVVRVEEIVII